MSKLILMSVSVLAGIIVLSRSENTAQFIDPSAVQ